MPEPHGGQMDAAELAGWVRLTSIPGVGRESQRQLLAAFGPPQAIFAATPAALHSVVGEALTLSLQTSDAQAEIDAARAWVADPGNHIVTLADADYPQALLTAPDPPVLLYVKGRIELLNRPSVAIVGSRNATRQGAANAEAFAAALAAASLTVVSGLALGIDAAAHRGALSCRSDNAGSTVAFIGTGADRIYPAGNEDLAREIASRGCIVSEFALGMPPLQGNFPRRNRLIAGIALGCLVVEAAARSGSLITARLAVEAGREVFAIPGSIHSPLSKGCHALIRQGAKLVEKAEDILEELRWEAQPVARSAKAGVLADAAEEKGLLEYLDDAPISLDTLASRCGLTPEQLLAMLLPLELEGRVAQLPGGFYQRLQQPQSKSRP